MDKQLNPFDDRAQAFTLEGLVSAIIVLTAVLFALQAVVITPTTGGAVDRATMGQQEQEIRDTLIVAGEKGNLSGLVRHWDPDSGEWRDANAPGPGAYNSTQFASLSDFGTILDEQVVNASGKSYNVDFIAHDLNPGDEDDNPSAEESIVRMGGGASDSVVTASYTVLVHEDQYFTNSTDDGFEETGTTVDEENNYPFHPQDSSEYVLVEVRVTVW
ncbi:hypothetical protein Halru_1295 [Halovivax ruber XH-70]|uniref:Uncharacterized protein n=1 Tax=Halovivax ruber (strain DSM 18193 / JCM 13892 / XH-70) TaxID=797302 RepID=L0IAY8_HALRX|nr:hypothetical protein [Halovivax ruber]AGB15909.1 hypothetical protein Halru_1295 [Halovivax ruber XH-70]